MSVSDIGRDSWGAVSRGSRERRIGKARKNAATISPSKCVPAHRLSSPTASAGVREGR